MAASEAANVAFQGFAFVFQIFLCFWGGSRLGNANHESEGFVWNGDPVFGPTAKTSPTCASPGFQEGALYIASVWAPWTSLGWKLAPPNPSDAMGAWPKDPKPSSGWFWIRLQEFFSDPVGHVAAGQQTPGTVTI